MKKPWDCKHPVIAIKRYDHGVDKRIVLSCKKCKRPLGEQTGPTLFRFLAEEEAADDL